MILTVATPGSSSTLRVHAWRKLRALGALALHQGVYVLPQRPPTVRMVNQLLLRLQREGATGRVLHVEMTEPEDERELLEAFGAERDDEYGEIVERTKEFFAEIDSERNRGRTTYTEVEESDADLKRFQKWLAAVRKRDYFGAEGQQAAVEAVAACEAALAEFEAEAFASELQGETGSAATQRKLRAVGGGGAA